MPVAAFVTFHTQEGVDRTIKYLSSSKGWIGNVKFNKEGKRKSKASKFSSLKLFGNSIEC
jgi:hypothetical protein